MNVVIFTPVRLLGEGLIDCLGRRDSRLCLSVVGDFPTLLQTLRAAPVDVVVIDVTQNVDLEAVRAVAIEWPKIALVALGLREQRQDIIRCGRAGFCGYVARDASVEALCEALTNAIAGRLECSADISAGLLRALFRADTAWNGDPEPTLTRREGDVLHLVGRGMSNKEIARELSLSVSTVKHHVHNMLDKMQLSRRTQAMRYVRENSRILSSHLSWEGTGDFPERSQSGTGRK